MSFVTDWVDNYRLHVASCLSCILYEVIKSGKIQCIYSIYRYLDNKVFVSLANGDLIVYKRDSEGIWDTENPYTRTIGSGAAPINRMLAVAGKLWCGCQNMMNVINPLTLRIEVSH
jgi:hypothetical protein